MVSIRVDGKEYNAVDNVFDDFKDFSKDQFRGAIKRAQWADKKEFVYREHKIQFIIEKSNVESIRATLDKINRPSLIGSSQKMQELGEAFDSLKNLMSDIIDEMEEQGEWKLSVNRSIRALKEKVK
jgi:hypothetical protein